MYIYMYVACTSVVHVWRSEDNLKEGMLSFYNVCLKDQTQGVKLSGKDLHLLRP